MSQPTEAERARYFIALTGFGSFRNNLRYVRRNEGNIEAKYWGRALFGAFWGLITTLTGYPFRVVERFRYDPLMAAMQIESPIFVLGHWRSGTTYLHNLLCQDEQFGYISLFQTIANDLCLVGESTIKPLLSKALPKTRPMDNVDFSLDNPEEEEHTLVRMIPYSFYHHWIYPKNARKYFDRYVLFDDAPARVKREWRQTYLDVLKKGTLNMDGRRLVLKNPVNTARIKLLLELFPDAKFIHIHRNPYKVFLSTRRLYQKVLPISQLQDISTDEVESNILLFYQKLMRRFLADKPLIPPKNYAEIRYEDLETDPVAELRRVYARLNLPGFAAYEPNLTAYLQQKAHYRKNQYRIAPDVVEKVNHHWGFAFKQWNYDML